MADVQLTDARPADPAGRALFAVSRVLAIIGGALLVLSALLTTLSIATHALFNSPIRGEFEVVSFGTSLAVYLFLPYCQLVKANVVVDFFFAHATERVRHAMDAVGSLLYALIGILLIWRMSDGAVELYISGQSGAVTKIPYWSSFPVILFCLAVLLLTTLYTLWRSWRGMRA